ncbi:MULTISPECIES: SDR family NAD(P)-dependent oxidoreductase [unclassified Sphingomonas]|uniref:SDR family NAD(P)-dependent oxidoreductase n=1 Tax=unclassified Sphingomonas TaxID=196159 RepID=UPI0007134ADF|nr:MULTISPECIES: SDR family oxidoreductase [unclassified Sphingomonas]KQO06108.1 3-oxoacyl-ACP reductase [Sphingomonas sp. Leaf242]TCP71801.1 D-xylose dehydrogenase [Sphingomonas sp. PP-CE-1G-424]
MLQKTQAADQTAIYPSLKGKRVLITGGASGIGAGLVEAFARQGAHVAFVDMAEDAAHDLIATLTPAVATAPIFLPLDLRDIDALKTTVATIESQLGGIDILINNAANDDRHTIEEITPEYWDERMATNLRHLFFAGQAVVPSMKRAGGGVILNFGSISWHLALPELMLYQTAKAGIEGMTRAMARDLGGDGIRVNTIVPGNVETPRQLKWYTPEGEAEIIAAQCLKTRVQPADVAALVLFLASDDARMCTGHDYFVDAGWR